ncbi:protein of unknown function DUF1291 [Ferroglobus placidus DSM 10642]|uniref:DsrE family protein n=1 Tax=Ferroglobus placidus (strain DSM 10642 / AEDII12DO) TaxID=589924 RepID=D3S2P0_FERPA|nr:hypothetical protein [Ferroglobus placidus]ADC64570.1 protein of unknown function DUF1291 [Ferroglobus placidus DSM 10642]
MPKLLVIISSGKEAKEKAKTGVLFAANSIKFGWAEKVEVVFFGASEEMLAEDEEFRQMVVDSFKDYKPLACRFIAESKGISDKLDFVRVEYVGKIINELIDEGFVPLVF